MRTRQFPAWWLALVGLWLLSTGADRWWLQADQALPAWDQADYLNSAVDHGRALGVLANGHWQGWGALLDLSPKIPPLASLIHGSVMAVAGETVDQASWALALWHGLLLLVVALWGRQLLCGGFGLLCAALVAISPALLALRVDFTLDLPLTAGCSLALWLLWRWQRPDPEGGGWPQAMAAALAIAAALLIKQSAVLVLAVPSIWALAGAIRRPNRRWQALAALALVAALLLPWLHHNWITTLGGTNRATFVSGSAEGDPSALNPESLIWYPRLWAQQLGWINLMAGLTGLALLGWQQRRNIWRGWPHPLATWPEGWRWLLGTGLSAWLCISLSPNKDPRYIAALLPLLCIGLARGWWQLAAMAPAWMPPAGLLGAGLLTAATVAAGERIQRIQAHPGSALPQLIQRLRTEVGSTATTLLVLPSRPSLNQHNTTYLGRLQGGRIVGRQPSKQAQDNAHTLEQGRWFLLSGKRSGMGPAARELAAAIRTDGRFVRVGIWPQADRAPLELWRRRPDAPAPAPFDRPFVALARGMADGPSGLARVMTAIGPEHQLDGHLLYQGRVQRWAEQRLAADPSDADALWTQALLAILRNRPSTADHWLQRLERRMPDNPWPAAYRTAVLLIDWRPWQAQQVAAAAMGRLPSEPVLAALNDLAGMTAGDLRRGLALRHSLPIALQRLKL